MTPDDVLERVRAIIKERGNSYGPPHVMFADIARRWDCDSRAKVAMCMAELKMARLAHKWDDDSAIDAIAYLMFAVMFASDD
jgi:hypothetical protein